ncbi:hypothetical protein AMTRI_Chr13g88580 [Amborella trichopoda]
MIQRTIVSWAYVSLPLSVVSSLSFLLNFKDIIMLKNHSLTIRRFWTKPPEGWFKLNFDGSVRGARSGFGGLLHDQ